MALAIRRSRAVLAVLVVAALAATWLVVSGAKPSHALNGKVLILSSTLASSASINEETQAATLGLGADVVDNTQWAAMTADQFAQYDAIVLGDPACDSAGDSATTLSAPLANLSTWIPAVTGNVFFSTSDAVFHANNGSNEAGATLQITKGLAFAAGGGTTGLYFTSSCYEDDAWTGVLNTLSTGWTDTANSSDDIHVTGSATLLAGLDDAALVGYGSTVHHLIDSWGSDFTVYAIATDAGAASADGQGASAAATPITGPYNAQDGTTGAPVILIRGANASPSHILLQSDQTHQVGEDAHLLATVTNPNLPTVTSAAIPVDGITVTFTVVSGPNVGKTMQGVTDTDGNVTIDYTSATAGADVWQASFVDPAQQTETSNQVTVTWTAPTPIPAAVVVTPRFTG
jgi:hypothetical protein